MSPAAAHPIQWVAPAPLWDIAAGTAPDPTTPGVSVPQMRQPALLTIPEDRFMDALTARLAAEPPDLTDLLAAAMSWRVRPPGEPDDYEPGGVLPPLKLYQPAHGHFNLIAASLICQVPGLPEHQVHPELKERVGFVIRRIAGATEYAWCPASNGAAANGAMGWSQITTDPGQPADGEQILPLFPVNFTLQDRPRRLYVGLIPTSSVETYQQPSSTPPPASPATADALIKMAFDTRVGDPLTQLMAAGGSAADGSPTLVLEFASFLNDWFPTSWGQVAGGASPSVNQSLYSSLGSTTADTGYTWQTALVTAWQQRDSLSGEDVPAPSTPLALNLANSGADATALWGWISAATPETSGSSVPGASVASAPKVAPGNGQEYCLRCVYQRPQCPPGSDIVSDHTDEFRIASFFDFDAPARQVTISLPLQAGIADLRKFRKNVNFLISEELHKQMDRIKDPKSILSGGAPGSSPGPTLGVSWICSFSIPIITICALFVLIMFVIILNIVFWWLPFFEVCLPVPKVD